MKKATCLRWKNSLYRNGRPYIGRLECFSDDGLWKADKEYLSAFMQLQAFKKVQPVERL